MGVARCDTVCGRAYHKTCQTASRLIQRRGLITVMGQSSRFCTRFARPQRARGLWSKDYSATSVARSALCLRPHLPTS